MHATARRYEPRESAIGHVGPISGIATHADTYVATAGYDNQVILWNARSKTPLTRVFHDHLANQCSFSGDGQLLVSSSSDYSARLWDVPSMRLRTILRGHCDDVEMALFDSTGERVATCSRDHTAMVFGVDGTRHAVCSGHSADVISVTWDAQDRSIVTSSDDGSVRVWDAQDGRCLSVFNLEGIETDTIVVVDSDWIFAGNDEGVIVGLSKSGQRKWQAHNAGIKRLAYDPRQRLLISLSYDRSFVLWRVGAAGELQRIDAASLPSVVWPRSCAFLGTSSIVFGTFGSAYAGFDLRTLEWDLHTIDADPSVNAVTTWQGSVLTIGDAGVLHRDGTPAVHLGSLCNFLTPYRGGVLTGGQLGEVYDALCGSVVHRHRSPINCAAVFRRGGDEWAIIGTYTGEGLLFKLGTSHSDHELVQVIRLHDNAIKGVAVANDEILSVCASGAAAFHSAITGEQLEYRDKGHERIANGCVALGAGSFASVGRDMKLGIWTDRTLERIDTPHRNSIKCVAASVDGRFVATGSYTGWIAVYDRQRNTWSKVVRSSANGISSITYDVECQQFLASSYDGLLHAVNASAG